MKPIIIITGPTGTGKTDFSLELADKLSGEIINADMGQMYTPLTIGTAKPDWKSEKIPHHLFDCIDNPAFYTAASYRRDVQRIITDIEAQGNTPIIVGGSGFYIQALLWAFKENTKPNTTSTSLSKYDDLTNRELWQILAKHDACRAQELHYNDRYRILRALSIVEQGDMPFESKPLFNPIRPFIIINLNRGTEELNKRIEMRLHSMIENGWIEEVHNLTPEWQSFVYDKKIIGYDLILDYLHKRITLEEMQSLIQLATKQYAKKQRTFWRGLKKKIEQALQKHPEYYGHIIEIDLTLSDHTLYINQLIDQFNGQSNKWEE
jgi:tRNA dimethylallyltransferase